MNNSDEFKKLLKAVITEKFPAEMIKEIEIKSVEFNEEVGEIRVELAISMHVEPEDFAHEYFGLTNFLRRSLKDKQPSLGGFFPVITPVFGQGAHA